MKPLWLVMCVVMAVCVIGAYMQIRYGDLPHDEVVEGIAFMAFIGAILAVICTGELMMRDK